MIITFVFVPMKLLYCYSKHQKGIKTLAKQTRAKLKPKYIFHNLVTTARRNLEK